MNLPFIKKPNECLTAELYNGLSLLCRLGAVGGYDAGLAHLALEPGDNNRTKIAYLCPGEGLIEFHLEPGIAYDSLPSNLKGFLEFSNEGLVLKPLLTFQPLTFRYPWLKTRLTNRCKEIEAHKLTKTIGASLATDLREIGARVEKAPELVSYYEVRHLWLRCIAHFNEANPINDAVNADCPHEFLNLEKAFARHVWLNRPFHREGPCMELFYAGHYEETFSKVIHAQPDGPVTLTVSE